MKPVPKFADELRIYLAAEKMENEEVLETLIENREEEEAMLLTSKQKVTDLFIGYMLPAEKAAKSAKLGPKGFIETLIKLIEKYPQDWKNLIDKYEVDGVSKHTPRLNAMIDRFEEISTILREMAKKEETENE